MTRFAFICEKFIFRKDLELPLIFILFFKGKKNKKENPKCDSWKEKIVYENRVGA